MNPTLCWICGAPADSSEHMVKASDLRAVFGKVTQGEPLYRHAGEERNLPIGGVNAAPMKFKPSICQRCNNARTQPHDKAWEALSAAARSAEPPLERGSQLPLQAAFGAEIENGLLGVHLYFVKLLGCHAVEYGVPLPIKTFAVAILGGYPHPNVFLSFANESTNQGKNQVHVGNISAANVDGLTVGATWYYIIGTFGVLVTYSEHGRPEPKDNPVWHPDDGNIKIALF
jgi:hypothetical protein